MRPKFCHNLFCCGRPDIGQYPTGKVAQQSRGILRQAGLTGFGTELFAIAGEVDHIAIRRNGHTVIHTAHVACHHNIGATGIHFKHGITGIRVFVYHMLNNAL